VGFRGGLVLGGAAADGVADEHVAAVGKLKVGEVGVPEEATGGTDEGFVGTVLVKAWSLSDDEECSLVPGVNLLERDCRYAHRLHPFMERARGASRIGIER
jgi:hypothetical protein